MRSKRSTRTKTSGKSRVPIAIISIVVVLAVTFLIIYKSVEAMSVTALGGQSNSTEVLKLSTDQIKSSKLYSQHVTLTDLKAGDELFSKEANVRCYPASLTKIMTALIAIENIKDLDKKVTISKESIISYQNENASMAGYYGGEKTTVYDLLYGCMLASGADASVNLALATCGNERDFVDLMNEKATELKMDSTHFTNMTGLQDEEHYTTANDMSKLLRYALKNHKFKDVFCSQSKNIKTDSREFTVHSSFFDEYNNELNVEESDSFNVLGAKTGTTSDAGQCLASYVNKDGREYILITLNAPIGESASTFRIEDLIYIFKTI